ncbi:response regulator [Propionivibrio sp.]|uniref:response regulator n=1 Tax=Propionivibrio sp. TaxID=2212460 RepID=UPI002615A3A8|nr:response regulator [Propionivibrio sp.]
MMQTGEPTRGNDKWRLALANYLVRLSEKIKALEIYSESHRAGVLSDEDRENLTNIFHQLSGSGGIYGFAAISDSARALEQTLKAQAPIACADIAPEIAQFCRDSKAAVDQKRINAALSEGAAACDAARSESDSLPLILAVDDDPTIRQAIHALLEPEARLLFGENTGEAEQLMRAHNPALVLLDDIMPNGLTGLKFLEKIKDDATLSKIPIIMITASDSKEDVLRGLAAGASDYITKPFNPETLRQVIRDFLARQQIRVVLKLKNRALVDGLADRLQKLRCLVIVTNEDLSNDLSAAGTRNAIIVCDRDTLPPEVMESCAAAYPACRFLCLDEADATPRVAETPSIKVVAQTNDADLVVRHIGSILASQKRK